MMGAIQISSDGGRLGFTDPFGDTVEFKCYGDAVQAVTAGGKPVVIHKEDVATIIKHLQCWVDKGTRGPSSSIEEIVTRWVEDVDCVKNILHAKLRKKVVDNVVRYLLIKNPNHDSNWWDAFLSKTMPKSSGSIGEFCYNHFKWTDTPEGATFWEAFYSSVHDTPLSWCHPLIFWDDLYADLERMETK